jgi:hypothetical protein
MTPEQNATTPEFVAEHELRIGALTTPIRVRIFRRQSDGALLAEQSQFLKTSIQYLPHTINQPFFCAENQVLDELTATMTNFYNQAIGRGYKPTENWLVPNTGFQIAVHQGS